MFDRLLEILFPAVNLLGSLQQNSPGGLDMNEANVLLRQSIYNEGQLSAWFHELQLGSPQEMSTPSSLPLLALYWLGLVVVYSSMTKTLCILIRTYDGHTSTKDLRQRLEEAELLSCHFTDRLLQSQTECVGMGQGTTILLMAASLAAQQICQNSLPL